MTTGRGILFWLGAWAVSAAVWLVLTDSVRIEELLAGALVAALAASGFELVRRQRIAEQALRPRLAVRLPHVLLGAVRDVPRLTRAAFAQLVRPQPARGRVLAVAFPNEEDDPHDRARRAVAAGLGSIAPNTIIIGIDAESGRLLAHQLEPTRKPSDLDPMGLR